MALIKELQEKLSSIANTIRDKIGNDDLIEFKKMPTIIRDRFRNQSNARTSSRSVDNDIDNEFANKIVNRTIETISATNLDGIDKIGDYAFYKCQYLTSVELPATIKTIGKGAFEKCTMLETLTLSTSKPPSLGDNAIPYTLKKIRVPKGSSLSYILWRQYLLAYGGTLEEY